MIADKEKNSCSRSMSVKYKIYETFSKLSFTTEISKKVKNELKEIRINPNKNVIPKTIKCFLTNTSLTLSNSLLTTSLEICGVVVEHIDFSNTDVMEPIIKLARFSIVIDPIGA